MTTPQSLLGGAALFALALYLAVGDHRAEAQVGAQRLDRYTIVAQGDGPNLWVLDRANATVRLCSPPAKPADTPHCGPPGRW